MEYHNKKKASNGSSFSSINNFCPFTSRDAESLVYTYKKEMRDMETQLKQQQNLYSAVRNDRTGLAKSLTEAQDEISDLKVITLFRNKRFALNEMFQQNVSKFAIFYV